MGCTVPNTMSAQAVASKQDGSQEPPLKYTLKMGDKSVTITEGEAVNVDGTFNNPEVILTAEPNRTFPYQGVKFDYPRGFNFEAGANTGGYKSWTLSGADFKISYYVFGAPTTTLKFANSMVKQFGKKNCKVSDATPLEFGGETLSGTSIQANIAGANLAVDIYQVPSSGKETRLLVLQDSLDDGGERSSEGKAGVKLLSESSKLDR